MNIRYPKPPAYLLTMPKAVLYGAASKIEAWCRDNNKCRPTLLDLESARRAMKNDRPRRSRG